MKEVKNGGAVAQWTETNHWRSPDSVLLFVEKPVQAEESHQKELDKEPVAAALAT